MTPSRTMIFTNAEASEPLPPLGQRTTLTGCPWHDVNEMLHTCMVCHDRECRSMTLVLGLEFDQ